MRLGEARQIFCYIQNAPVGCSPLNDHIGSAQTSYMLFPRGSKKKLQGVSTVSAHSYDIAGSFPYAAVMLCYRAAMLLSNNAVPHRMISWSRLPHMVGTHSSQLMFRSSTMQRRRCGAHKGLQLDKHCITGESVTSQPSRCVRWWFSEQTKVVKSIFFYRLIKTVFTICFFLHLYWKTNWNALPTFIFWRDAGNFLFAQTAATGQGKRGDPHSPTCIFCLKCTGPKTHSNWSSWSMLPTKTTASIASVSVAQ